MPSTSNEVLAESTRSISDGKESTAATTSKRTSRKHWYKSGLADKSGVDGSRLPEAAPEAGVAGGIRPSTLYDFGS